MFKKILLAALVVTTLIGTSSLFAANSLSDTEWNLTTYNQQNASGTLSFTHDMLYSQFCNNVSQGYTYINNKIISQGNAISTMMYCEGLPMTLENNFTISTSGTSSLVNGAKLTITTADNNVFVFTKKESDAIACTMEYAPVCGEIQVQCIKAPCPPIQQTYGNACMAGVAGAKIISKEACSPLVGGDSDEHGCKASAGYGRDHTSKECVRPWEQESILRAYDKGITKYNTMGTFMPNSFVTREQAAKMLMTTIDTSGIAEWMIKQPEESCTWKDQISIDLTLTDQVLRSCAKGIFKGSDEGFFLPHEAITREHMTYILKRLETFVPKIKEHSYIAQENNITPYTRLEFVEVLQQISQVLEKAATQDFTQQTTDLETAKKLWKSKQITNYKMVQQRSCFCPTEYIRPMIYDVKDSKAQRGTARYDDKDKEQVSQAIEVSLNSVDDAFKIIQDAITNNVDSLEVEYDTTYGYPTKINIDYNFMIADEEQYLTFKVIR